MRGSVILFLFLCAMCLSFREVHDPPAGEWYDDESWSSLRVNPYLGKRPLLPNRVIIPCYPFSFPTGELGRVSSKYGWRSNRMHRGIDIALPSNSPVYSTWSGIVRTKGVDATGFGKYIVVRHSNGLETVYGHLNSILVQRGDKVLSGDLIGLSGNTGRSTGPHLHFEVRYKGGDFSPSLIINFEKRHPMGDTFLWTKHLYPKNNKRSGLKVYRLKEDTTLELLCEEKDWDLEELCLLNGVLPDMQLKKGRMIRCP